MPVDACENYEQSLLVDS